MKLRRSDRMVVISNYLINNPYKLTSLNTFAEKYESAKSSISEDIVIIKRAFEEIEIGHIQTGDRCWWWGYFHTIYLYPWVQNQSSKSFAINFQRVTAFCQAGYIYLSDLLSTPAILKKYRSHYCQELYGPKDWCCYEVATKGVPLANAVANVLNVPFVIVRRDLKITEGSTVSVNYVSGSSDRIEKMFLSKRSLKAGSRVLIVDDFLKGGGTINGMISLLAEFDSELAGVAVFADNAQEDREQQFDYKSLLKVTNIDVKNQQIEVEVGNIFETEK